MDRFGTGRERFKRSYSNTMAAAPEADNSDSLFVSPDRNISRAQDEHYNNGHDSSRPRLHLPTPPVRRWAGDGVDHRRPVMSHGGGAAGSTGGVTRSGALSEIIDLTEGDAEEAVPQPPPAQHMFEEMMQQDDSNARATEGNSRAQRPPRFGRNIIAIDDSSDDEERRTSAARTTMRENGHPPRPQFAGLRRPGHVRQPSPPTAETEDFEITGERTASRPQTMSRQPTPNMALPRSFTPLPGQAAVDLTQDDDDDVVHVNTTTRDNGVNAGGPIQFGGYRAAAPDPVHPPRRRFGFGEIGDLLHPGHLRNHIMRRMGVGSAATRNEELEERALHEAAIGRQTNRHEGHRHHHHHHHHHAHGNGHHHHHHQRPHLGDLRGAVQHFGIDIATRQRERREDATMRLDFGMGIGMMDYEEVAFDMGLGGNRPASPEYKAPGDAKEGFTRSPREDEEVVCPNCGDELAVGDGDLKQQVWVVKSCGHAYCGECAEKRNASKNPKGKGKARAIDKPLKKCVVEDCGKPLTGKSSMVHVYMSS